MLTGQSPAGLRCLLRDRQPGDAAGLVKALHKTYRIEPNRANRVITISAGSEELAWSYAQFALANARDHGVTTVQVGDRAFKVNNRRLASWRAAGSPIRNRAVRITVR